MGRFLALMSVVAISLRCLKVFAEVQSTCFYRRHTHILYVVNMYACVYTSARAYSRSSQVLSYVHTTTYIELSELLEEQDGESFLQEKEGNQMEEEEDAMVAERVQ